GCEERKGAEVFGGHHPAFCRSPELRLETFRQLSQSLGTVGERRLPVYGGSGAALVGLERDGRLRCNGFCLGHISRAGPEKLAPYWRVSLNDVQKDGSDAERTTPARCHRSADASERGAELR